MHKRMFALFGNITRLADTSIENKLAKRQLKVKTFKSHNWFVAVKKILIKYGIPSAETLLENQMEEALQSAVNTFWSERIVSQSRLYLRCAHIFVVVFFE